MANSYQQLGQSRPSGTTATSLYSPGAGEEVIIKSIIVTNTSGSSATYRLFVDSNGTTYDETTAIAWDITLGGGETDIFEGTICMNDSSGNLAVRTDTADALTFTANGLVIT